MAGRALLFGEVSPMFPSIVRWLYYTQTLTDFIKKEKIGAQRFSIPRNAKCLRS